MPAPVANATAELQIVGDQIIAHRNFSERP
jgi:hypothetical protein